MRYSTDVGGALHRAGAPAQAEPPASGVTRQVFLARTAGGLVGFSSLAAFLAACGGSSSSSETTAGSPPARPTGTLRVALPSPPSTFDPTLLSSLSDLTVAANVFESLVGFTSDYSALAPALATKWSVSRDAREWQFTLRQGVKFHDGADLDAAAVKANLEYMQRRTGALGFLVGTPTIDVSDPTVVKLTYRAPFPDLAHNLTFGCSLVSPRLLGGSPSAAEKRVAKQHVGTGPFQFAGQQGQSITLHPFEGHWGAKAHLETVQFVTIAEESSRVSALQAGDVDLIMQVAPLASRSLKTDSRVHVTEASTWTTVILGLVCNRKPFDDPKVRQAVAYALDREALVSKVLLGDALLDDSMLPPGVPGYAKPATTYSHDLAKARQLLQQAGAENVAVRLCARSDATLANELTQAIAAQLNDAGFKANAEVLEPSVFEADKASPSPKHDAFFGEWGWVTGGPFHLTIGSMAGNSKYTAKAYTDLVARINTVPDGPQRDALIAQAVDIWARDVPWVTLWVPKRLDATAANVQAYRPPANVSTLLGTTYVTSA